MSSFTEEREYDRGLRDGRQIRAQEILDMQRAWSIRKVVGIDSETGQRIELQPVVAIPHRDGLEVCVWLP